MDKEELILKQFNALKVGDTVCMWQCANAPRGSSFEKQLCEYKIISNKTKYITIDDHWKTQFDKTNIIRSYYIYGKGDYSNLALFINKQQALDYNKADSISNRLRYYSFSDLSLEKLKEIEKIIDGEEKHE